MQVKNTSLDEIKKALDLVNKKYEGNIRFHSDGITSKNQKGTRLQFKLYTHSVEKAGHRRHFRPDYSKGFDNPPLKSRRSRYACWHAHGDFFDALLNLNPKAVIRVGRAAGQVYDDAYGRHGNWEDFNIGSQVCPIYFSQSCDCEGGQ